jgi:preprotein translocase subunit SecY
LIFIFAYYYVSVITNPVEIAENLKKNGAFIPTVRPGKQTADYLYGILTRLTFWGAIYISLVCIVPDLIYRSINLPQISYVFGGTAVLIAVGVTLDTASQIQSIMMASHYEAFMAKSASGKGIAGPFRGTRTRILRR